MNAQSLLGFLIDASIKSAPVFGAALVIVRFQRRTTAAFRHAILAAAVFAALALLPLIAALPQWRLAILPPAHGPGGTLRPVDPLLPASADGAPKAINSTTGAAPAQSRSGSSTRSDASNAPTTAKPWTSNWSWHDAVLLVWLGGTIATLGTYLAGRIGAIGIARSAPVAPSGELHRRFTRLKRRMGIHMPVLLRVGGRVRSPMAMGIFRPAVLLPAEIRDWPEPAVDAAILHELAHVRRHDPAVQLLAWLACAVYWFNPLPWLTAARMRIEREFACDDAVLRQEVEPAGYARLLVDVARSIQSSWLAAVPMARRSSLKDRVRTILDESADRRPMRIGGRMVIAGSVALILLALSPLKLATRTARAAPPATAVSTNAADVFLQAAELVNDNDKRNIWCPAASSVRYTGYPPYSKEWTAMESADYPANIQARELAHKGRSLEKAVWPDESLPDIGDYVKHINALRNLANELADAAIWEHLQGDDASAIETIRDLLHLSLLVRQSPHNKAVSTLVSAGFDAIAMDRLNVIVSTVQLTGKAEDKTSLSISTARTLMDELAADQLDPAQAGRDASAETGPAKISPDGIERLITQVTRVALEMDMARLNLACHLYRHDHATWPASLDDLHAYVPQIPIDRLGDGKKKLGYVIIKRGLPDGSDRPLIYSRAGNNGLLFYHSAEPTYSFYMNADPATGKFAGFNAGGQFRDVAGWSPANHDNPPPTTMPVE